MIVFDCRRFLRTIRIAATALAALTLGVAGARAQEAEGVWMREDGASKVQFSPCGGGLCGTVVWLKNPNSKAHIGQKVFFDMARADQTSWTGQAFNPEDGKTYSGKIVVNGKKLRTSGCVLGGLICKSMNWVRAN
ncbi:DUF2147 domain-containing protein [Rhodoblastus sp.]|uniref:DUF2147 domain-containing protein n=1 Tax=Rhodoblastus sp. TaxID=1962975 RepID=UPI0035B3F1D1